MSIERAFQLHKDATRNLAQVALDKDSREYWEAVQRTALSVVLFG
jgi:hypothetical protein